MVHRARLVPGLKEGMVTGPMLEEMEECRIQQWEFVQVSDEKVTKSLHA